MADSQHSIALPTRPPGAAVIPFPSVHVGQMARAITGGNASEPAPIVAPIQFMVDELSGLGAVELLAYAARSADTAWREIREARADAYYQGRLDREKTQFVVDKAAEAFAALMLFLDPFASDLDSGPAPAGGGRWDGRAS